MRFARLALVLVPLALVSAAMGCASSNTDGPQPLVSGSVELTPPSNEEAARASAQPGSPEAVQAVSGKTLVRGLMGLAATPSSDPSRARAEAMATHVIAVLERAEPGSLDRFSNEMRSKDEKRIVAAYVGIRARLVAVTDSPDLRAELESDPLFAGQLVPTSKSSFGGHVAILAPGDGIPDLGRGADGRFGDSNTGAWGAIKDSAGLVAIPGSLRDVDNGTYVPDPESRLGAYAATRGYPPGSVGEAVHNAIGTIYVLLGTFGEEKIGRVFNSPEARALYGQPVESAAGAQMAAIEQRYWANVAKEDPASPGGQLGASFSATVRDSLQRHIFGNPGSLDAGTAADSSVPTNDAGTADAAPTDCNGRADGWWCQGGVTGFMVYCGGGQIGGGCPCAACGGTAGQRASCSNAAPPAACTSR